MTTSMRDLRGDSRRNFLRWIGAAGAAFAAAYVQLGLALLDFTPETPDLGPMPEAPDPLGILT